MKYINHQEERVLQTFQRRVLKAFPHEISEIRVFGSKVRGDASADSDIDVLVVTNSDDWRTGDAIREMGYELDAEIGYKLSIQVVPASHARHLADNHFTFYKNISREGIAI